MLAEGVLESPEQKYPVLENITCYQSRVEISERPYLLRILVNETVTLARVCRGLGIATAKRRSRGLTHCGGNLLGRKSLAQPAVEP
jgi:hypothetical protein